MSHHTRITATENQHTGHLPDFASILIVDDQRFDRRHLKKLCRAFECTTHVMEADSLASLRDKLRKDRFDLILIDYHLTDGTGLEGVDIIRADPVNCHAATVMITGTEQSDVAVQALKLGFSDYLSKDELTARTLTRAAISALQKSQLSRGIALQATPPVAMNGSLQSFSRECAQDIKPIVSRIMRQMRGLREIEKLDAEDALERVEHVEGSLRRLWAFLDDLDQLGGATSGASDGPTVASTNGASIPAALGVNARVPSVRPERPASKTTKPPSIFRRRPD
jgi:CheY-like chemotaxis protein